MLKAALLSELFKLGEHDNRRELQLPLLSGYIVSLERPIFRVEVFRRYRRFILCNLKLKKACFVVVITHTYLLDLVPRRSPVIPHITEQRQTAHPYRFAFLSGISQPTKKTLAGPTSHVLLESVQ